MTAKQIIDMNGDFKTSPLAETVERIHEWLSSHNVPYVIVGGMAVIRNGGLRTTHDIDILTSRRSWETIRGRRSTVFETGDDFAVDMKNGIHVDVLFAGDDWDMAFPMPEPDEVGEYDSDFKARFMSLFHILQLKTAVYMEKRESEGIEAAAKDLADIVMLVEKNPGKIDGEFIKAFHPAIREEFGRIVEKVQKRKKKRLPRKKE
ncbi:MAG: hypothetical protein JW881_10490 [Spirochaetales bacterium]|nr:hypothetical protein [Spirochaetales bacterium]